MNILSIVFAAAILTLACVSPTPSEAKKRVYLDFGFHNPGVDIYVGRYPRYRYYDPYYRPYTYRRTYRRRSYSKRCARWSRRCAANWGYRSGDYYGCMRYHRCR